MSVRQVRRLEPTPAARCCGSTCIGIEIYVRLSQTLACYLAQFSAACEVRAMSAQGRWGPPWCNAPLGVFDIWIASPIGTSVHRIPL